MRRVINTYSINGRSVQLCLTCAGQWAAESIIVKCYGISCECCDS